MVKDEAKAIIGRIEALTHDSKDLGRLMEILYNGGDLELLRPLLESNDELLVTNGAYILSELGKVGEPLLPVARTLLRHPRRQVRYWAMNSVMCCADRETAASAIVEAGLLSDPWELTRWASARFLGRDPPERS